MNDIQKRNRYDQGLNMVLPVAVAGATATAKSETARPIVRRMSPAELNQTAHTINVPQSAQHYVEMRTSAKDRAEGFLIATVPLFAGLAFGMVLVSVFFFGVPFLSLTALVVFWLSFVAAWLLAYVYTLAVSAEGIAMFEAKKKWQVIEREQQERWKYYRGE